MNNYEDSNTLDDIELRLKELDTRKRELDLRGAEILRRMLDNPQFPITPEIQTAFALEIFRLTTGYSMLPEGSETEGSQKYYTADEIGAKLGISAEDVERIAKAHGLIPPVGQTNEYGKWVYRK